MNIWNQMRPSTKDRILFFVIGALLATIAYIAGDADNSVNADSPTIFDENVWIKGTLLVSGGSIILEEDSNNDRKSYIDLHVEEGLSLMHLVHGPSKNPETHPAASDILLVAHDGVEFPSSSITLSGKNGKDKWNIWSFLPK